MMSVNEKGLKPTGNAASGHSDTQFGDVHDLQGLTLLGYKPELQRNRSMFTLLFQSLAIAAVSLLLYNSIRKLKLSVDTVWLWQPFD
jgi:hypothetical protein